MMNENFKRAKEQLSKYIGDGKCMVLSTYTADWLTSRTISAILFNDDIYFISNKESTKYKQILQNPKVALCENMLQMNGTAEIIGHPLDTINQEIKDIFLFAFTDWFNQYSVSPNAVLIKVVLTSSIISLNEEGGFVSYSINFNNKTADRRIIECA